MKNPRNLNQFLKKKSTPFSGWNALFSRDLKTKIKFDDIFENFEKCRRKSERFRFAMSGITRKGRLSVRWASGDRKRKYGVVGWSIEATVEATLGTTPRRGSEKT